jgi:hypothetical protein
MHGLRKLLGKRLVDYPRKGCVYNGVLGLGVCPDDQKCPDWFPYDNGQIDRTEIWEKVHKNYFDFVICDLRAIADVINQLGHIPKNCVIIDGEDHPQHIPPGPYIVFRRETDGSDYSVPLPMALPEEVFNWIATYDGTPKCYSIGFLGSSHNDNRKSILENLSHRYANTLFQATGIPSDENPVPKGRMSRDLYYRQLQQCHVLLSLSGAGYDTFRFWEHAACSGVHIAPRFPIFIPNDFKKNEEIMRFDGSEDLSRIIDKIIDEPHGFIELAHRGRRKLLQHHLTTHRATYFLDRTKKAFDI